MTFRDPNGNELQFDGEFAMTKQSVSIFSGSIKGDVSITFSVDNNSVNREILNYQGPQMLNQIAFVKQPFARINKGNLLDYGYIVIQEEDGPVLKCFYLSGNSNWMQLLSQLITELDYSGVTNGKNYVKNFNRTVVIASATEGITFPFIDWCFAKKKGNNAYVESNTSDCWVDVNGDTLQPLIQFYPCFYMQSLVNEIFSQAYIKKDGNVFQDQLYKSLALPPVNGQMKRQPFKNVILNGSSQTYSSGVGVYEKIKGLTLRQSDSSTWDDITKRFTAPTQSLRYISFTMTAGNANRVRVYKNGVPQSSFTAVTLGIKQKIELNSLFVGAESAGDYYELYAANSAASPFTASFDIEYEIPEVILFSDYIDPADFLPSLKSIDVIKFLINFFGCSAYFDATSKTITITIIEKLKLEDAYDWSEFYQSHKSYFIQDTANHNYINWGNSPDTTITKYNQSHTLKFADGDLLTNNTLLDQRQISKLPFNPSISNLCYNGIYCLDIPLINLVDDGDPILFTSMGLDAAGPPARTFFTTGSPSVLNDNEVVRVTNGSGVNIGYYCSFPGGGGPTGEILVFPFLSTDSGKIWRQKINYQTLDPKVITVKPATNITDFSTQSTLLGTTGVSATLITSFDYAAFTKSFTGLPIDQWKNNLAIDNPDSGGFTDPTIKELYFNKIGRFIKNPQIEAIMTLPDSVYQRFKFDQFIYLKTEKLTGYFFVDSIQNYVDSKTPVKVNLYML